jgi:hypothetical protein
MERENGRDFVNFADANIGFETVNIFVEENTQVLLNGTLWENTPLFDAVGVGLLDSVGLGLLDLVALRLLE